MNWQERAEKAESELAKAREQKPAGYVFGDWRGATTISAVKSSHFNTPLYAAPVPEQSQGKPAAPDAPDAGWRRFTDDDLAEIHQLAYELGGTDSGEYLLDGDQLDQVVVKCASLFYAFPVKSATAVPSGFAKKMCAYKPYLLSETHSGRYRIVIGFHSMEELHDCHASLVDLLQSAEVRHDDAAADRLLEGGE